MSKKAKPDGWHHIPDRMMWLYVDGDTTVEYPCDDVGWIDANVSPGGFLQSLEAQVFLDVGVQATAHWIGGGWLRWEFQTHHTEESDMTHWKPLGPNPEVTG